MRARVLDQVASPWVAALQGARASASPEPAPAARGVMSDAAAGVMGRLMGGGKIDMSIVPCWYGESWMCRTCDPEEDALVMCQPGDQSRRDSRISALLRTDMAYDPDNVFGCVRDLVTPMGGVGRFTGEKEVRSLPPSGSIVVLCRRDRCVVPYDHPADPGGLWSGKVRDGVRGGVPYRTSACHRTCSGCGVTWAARSSRTRHMWVCGGCHAFVPFMRAGHGDHDEMARMLDCLLDASPVYCGRACQALHWDGRDGAMGHGRVCRRHDLRLHDTVAEIMQLETMDGDDYDYPEYGVHLEGGGTMPFLVAADRHQPGLADGWGHA